MPQCVCVCACEREREREITVSVCVKLQSLVYNILPSTTAVFSYAIGSRKLLANEQFFVGAQTVVSLLPTTQMISDVSFIADHVATPAQINQNCLKRNGTLFFFFIPEVDASHVYVLAWALNMVLNVHRNHKAY